VKDGSNLENLAGLKLAPLVNGAFNHLSGSDLISTANTVLVAVKSEPCYNEINTAI
jgi:hypothetical protein